MALLGDELGATLSAHDVEADGAAVRCVTWRTRGFAALGHPELTITYTRAEDDDDLHVLSLDAIRFFTGLFSRAKGGAPPLAAGMTAEYPPGLFDSATPPGAAFVRAFDIDGLTQRRHGLAVVLLHVDELAVARAFGVRRVLARLARRGRYTPFPFWWEPERPTVARDDEASSVLEATPRMVVTGASATLLGDTVRVRLPPDRARAVAGALEKHGDATFAWLTDAELDADAFLVWEPGQASPSAALSRGSRGAAVAGNFVRFAPDAARDRGALLEDGFSFELTTDSWAALRRALEEGAPFELPPGGRSKGLSIAWDEARPDAPPAARYEHVEVFAGLQPPRNGVDPKELTDYVKRVCAATDRHFEESWYATGQDLLVHMELHPGRRPRADLALRPGPPHAAVNGLCSAVESIAPPAVTAPVVFRVAWSLWGGAGDDPTPPIDPR